MTRNADMMYDTKPPSPHRSRIILGDGSIRKVQFVGKLDLVFHSRTNHPVTLHDVSFVPDLGFNLFSFHVVQEKHEIILNKTGAYLLNGRLLFLRRSNGSSKATERRSVSGGLIMCGGASVCWFSRTQKCVTLSTSEAEYVALGDAVKELLFLRQVWRFMLPSKVMPCFPVFEDNQGAVQLAQNPITSSNSKHIDVGHRFLRELVCQRNIKVVQVPSKFQHADILTKALAFDLFAFDRKFLMNLK